MGRRRRSPHRAQRAFLKVTEAESTADAQALMRRVRRAIHEAEVLGLPDVRARLDEALALVDRHARGGAAAAGQDRGARSIGQHGSEPAGT